jgi:hypothetical protein
MESLQWIRGKSSSGESGAVNLALVVRMDYSDTSAALLTTREGQLIVALVVSGDPDMKRLEELRLAGQWLPVRTRDSTVGEMPAAVNLNLVARVLVGPDGSVDLQSSDGTWLGTIRASNAAPFRRELGL